ncbi:MAG: MFS transporter [Actinomycetaceae bacterium]|nr:MFS transporter [Actinomycetaceae bacterium]
MRHYWVLLRRNGAWKFSLAGFVARYPMAMMAMAIALAIPVLYPNNYTLAGQVAAVNVMAYALGAPFISRLVDRHGQWRVLSKTILVFGASLGALAAAAWAGLPTPAILAAAAMAGFFSGSLGSMVRSRWAARIERPGELTQAFALEAAFDEVAFTTGPMVATVLVTAVHPLAGLVGSAIIQAVGGYCLIVQRSSEPPIAPRQAGRSTSIMRSGAICVLGVTYAGAGSIFGALDLAVVAFCSEASARSMAGILLGICSAGSLLGALLYGSRMWPLSQGKLFLLGIVVLACGSTALLAADSLLSLALILAATGVCIAPTMTNVNAMVQRIVHPSRLTEGLTWLSTFMNIGVAIGAALAGRLIDASGAVGGFQVVAASALAMVIVALGCAPILRSSLHRADRRRAIDADLQTERSRRGESG